MDIKLTDVLARLERLENKGRDMAAAGIVVPAQQCGAALAAAIETTSDVGQALTIVARKHPYLPLSEAVARANEHAMTAFREHTPSGGITPSQITTTDSGGHRWYGGSSAGPLLAEWDWPTHLRICFPSPTGQEGVIAANRRLRAVATAIGTAPPKDLSITFASLHALCGQIQRAEDEHAARESALAELREAALRRPVRPAPGRASDVPHIGR